MECEKKRQVLYFNGQPYTQSEHNAQLWVADKYIGLVGCTQCRGRFGELGKHDEEMHKLVKEELEEMRQGLTRFHDTVGLAAIDKEFMPQVLHRAALRRGKDGVVQIERPVPYYDYE